MIQVNATGRRGARERRGNATLVALIAVTVLGGMSAGILALSTSSEREAQAATESIRAQFAAEAGVANALQELSIAFGDPAGGTDGAADAGQVDNLFEDLGDTSGTDTGDTSGSSDTADSGADTADSGTGSSGGDSADTGTSTGGDTGTPSRRRRRGSGGTGSAAATTTQSTGSGGSGNNGVGYGASNNGKGNEERTYQNLDLSGARLGTYGAPMRLANSSYYSEITELGDGLWQILATGISGGKQCRIEVIAQRAESPVYDNAVFAGNSSGDMNYTMSFGGRASQGDRVTGDIYSGGNIDVAGDALVNGSMRAYGSILPRVGTEGLKLSPPDLAAMDYANTADFDVAAMFSTATYKSDNAGGSAWQMPEESPAHIFRKNPSDRSSDTSGTSKDDYFLEDPYEPVRVDSSSDGSDPYMVTVSGQGDEPGESGDNKVYYIDGNLWLHNRSTMSLGIASPDADGTRLTFVVEGNIYFSDNLFYENPTVDGVVFIALGDPDVEDSGNIYFGDPVFGTLEAMQAFMYAENNFYDNNLDASGSAQVVVNGNMTAGNHVLINRDYGNQHSRLTVDFDTRISSGTLSMPGLPEAEESTGGFTIVSWREVPVD